MTKSTIAHEFDKCIGEHFIHCNVFVNTNDINRNATIYSPNDLYIYTLVTNYVVDIGKMWLTKIDSKFRLYEGNLFFSTDWVDMRKIIDDETNNSDICQFSKNKLDLL